MKRIVTLLVLLLPVFGLKAQIQLEDTTNMTVAAWRNVCFGLLDKSPALIPSGFLLEYSLAAFPSDRYDGAGSPDTIRGYTDFLQCHSILELSKVNANATLTPTDDIFITAHRRKRTKAIPFAFLFKQYQTINPSALASNLVAVSADGQRLSDVPGRPSSPYLTKEAFIFAPFESNIVSSDKVSFTFPADLWQMAGITQVTIDFGDGGGNRTVNKGDSLVIYYGTSGMKYITATISTMGGTRTAKSVISYTRPQNYYKTSQTVSINVPPVYTDVNDYLGVGTFGIQSICTDENIFNRVDCDINPGAEIRVVLGCDRVFDRPVIILSGFNPGGTTTLEQHVGAFEEYDFINSLIGRGHDLVFVTLKKPTDFIENNAKVLEAVINWVNTNKTGSNDGSVIGYSMGGLVARWCLRDMENRGLDHNIAHYFSYDSPQQGANIPLGFQHLINLLEYDFPYLKLNHPWPFFQQDPLVPELQSLMAANASPAARQMLVTKATYSNGIPSSSSLDPVRAAFAARLAALGYPQNAVCHGIAFGRGNNPLNTRNAGNGAQFGFGASDKILESQLALSLVSLEAHVYASPEGSVNNYITKYRFAGMSVRKLFGFIPVIATVIHVRNIKYTGVYPYDYAPGSYEASQTMFAERINGFGANLPWAGTSKTFNHHGHNFIPTVSALDLTNQNYGASTSWQSSNLYFNIDQFIQNPGQVTGNTLSTPSLSPFDFVHTYTSDCGGSLNCASFNTYLDGTQARTQVVNTPVNQYHNGTISRQAARYIFQKIVNVELLPGENCAQLCEISNTLTEVNYNNCDIRSLFLQETRNGYNYVWENLTPSLITIVGGQNTTWIDVIRAGAGMGTASVRLTISGPCGVAKVITHSFQIGAPVTSFTRLDSDHQKMYITVTPMPGATGYNYFIDGVLRRQNVGSGITHPLLDCGEHIVGVQVIYPCGLSAINEGVIEMFCFAFNVSPNPATDIVTVTPIAAMPSAQTNAKMSKQTETPALKPITELRLYDAQSRLVKMQKGGNSTGSVNIETIGLPTGMYLLEIYSGKEKQVKKVMIVR